MLYKGDSLEEDAIVVVAMFEDEEIGNSRRRSEIGGAKCLHERYHFRSFVRFHIGLRMVRVFVCRTLEDPGLPGHLYAHSPTPKIPEPTSKRMIGGIYQQIIRCTFRVHII